MNSHGRGFTDEVAQEDRLGVKKYTDAMILTKMPYDSLFLL